MYDEMLRVYKEIMDPIVLLCRPEEYEKVRLGLEEAKERNQWWPTIELKASPYIPEGVIIWMKKPQIPNPPHSIYPKPDSSENTNM